MAHKEIDHATGVETTGHVWDGDLKELNKPLPRWWLYTFYACILWAIGYWVVYPTWPVPGGYTKGMLGYSPRDTVTRDVANAKLVRGDLREKLAKTPLADSKGRRSAAFRDRRRHAAFQTTARPATAVAPRAAAGYPNLQDDDWLWGGKIDGYRARRSARHPRRGRQEDA